MKIKQRLRVVTRGVWGHRANTYFYEVTAMRKRKDNPKGYKEIRHDYELTCIGFQKIGVAFVGDDFQHEIILARELEDKRNTETTNLTKLENGEEIDLMIGWVKYVS